MTAHPPAALSAATTVKTMRDGYKLPIDRPDWLNLADLWGRGWSVIPLDYRGKKPAITSWLEYQTRTATYAELEHWFSGRPRLRPLRAGRGFRRGDRLGRSEHAAE